jgi:hypothetical protein
MCASNDFSQENKVKDSAFYKWKKYVLLFNYILAHIPSRQSFTFNIRINVDASVPLKNAPVGIKEARFA